MIHALDVARVRARDRILDVARASVVVAASFFFAATFFLSACDLGVPTTLVTEAVFARCLSAQKDARGRASKVLPGPAAEAKVTGDKKQFIEDIRQALYASKIVSYAQGFVQLDAAAKEFGWELNNGNIALLWRGGCIIRSRFLEDIKRAGASGLLVLPVEQMLA